MSGISLGGMASGLDTNSIIDQLMQVEAVPQTRLSQRQTVTQARSDLMKDIQSRLKAVRATLTTLQSVTTWANTQTLTNSDATKMTATLTGGAAPGPYSVSVTQLARAEQRTYNYTAPTNPNRTLTIGSFNLSLANGQTIDQTVDAINNSASSPVTAVKVGTQMVLTAKTTGTSSAFSATSTGGVLTEDTTKARVGQNATGTVDGVAFSSQTNSLTTGIVGVTLALSSTTTSPVTITVGAPGVDKDKVTKAAQAFVDSYNSALTFISGKLKEQKIANPQTDGERLKGLVFSDSMLSSVMSQLRSGIADPLSGSASTMDQLSELGISTGATTGSGTINQDNVAGLLKLDTATLSTALDTNVTGVKRLLFGDTTSTGISGRLATTLDAAAGTGGMIDGRVDVAGREITSMKDQMTALQQRLEAKRKMLQAQFTAMETALSNSHSQQQWLVGQINSLPSGG